MAGKKRTSAKYAFGIAGLVIAAWAAFGFVFPRSGERDDDEPVNPAAAIINVARAVYAIIVGFFSVHDTLDPITDSAEAKVFTAQCSGGQHKECDGHGPCACKCHAEPATT